MTTINKTLLIKLFHNPFDGKPSPIASVYNELVDRIFPDKSKFIEFLEADTIDRQYELGIHILRRLCFESNFPPPFSAYMDILILEGGLKGQEHSGDKIFVARDHVLHLIYLYLLGIYIFFYDNIFFNKLMIDYKFRRRIRDYSSKELDRTKDFISAWKYFCLYHDIGYSIEMLGSEGIRLPSRNSDFAYSFEALTLKKSIAISSTIKTMTRVVFVQQLLNNSILEWSTSNPVIERIQAHCIRRCRISKDSEIVRGDDECTFGIKAEEYFDRKDRHNYRLLDKVYSNHCLKVILSVIDKTNFIVLAFNKQDGREMFCVFPAARNSNRDLPYEVYAFTGSPSSEEFARIVKNPGIIFFDDYVSEKFDFQYYVNTIPPKDSLLYRGSDYWKYINHIAKYIDGREDWDQFVRINTEEEFYNYQYVLYNRFNKFIAELDIYDHVDDLAVDQIIKDYTFQSIIESKGPQISDIFFKSLQETLFSQVVFSGLKKSIHKKNPIQDNPNEIEKVISFFVDELKSKIISLSESKRGNLEIFCNSFHDKIKDELFSLIDMHLAEMRLFKHLLILHKEMFAVGENKDCKFHFDYDKQKIIHSMKTEYSKSIESRIAKEFREYKSNTSSRDLESIYLIPYGLKHDHGIISAKCYAYITELFEQLSKTTDDNTKKILAAIWNIPTGDEIALDKCISNYIHVKSDVYFALFMHNIKPKNFTKVAKKKDGFSMDPRLYRTKIDNTFAYLAFLSDSIQQWNRPHLTNPKTLENKPNIDASKDYDIDIENDFIIVYEKNTETSQEKLKADLLSLSEQLDRSRSFIRPGFSKL